MGKLNFKIKIKTKIIGKVAMLHQLNFMNENYFIMNYQIQCLLTIIHHIIHLNSSCHFCEYWESYVLIDIAYVEIGKRNTKPENS